MAFLAKGHDKSHDDKRRDTVIKTVILLILAFIIFVLATIAWFTMNKSTSAAGMSVKASSDYFEIATIGDNGVRNDEQITLLAPEYQYGTAKTIDGDEYYTSEGTGGSLKLRYTSGDSEIAPGGNGELSLYVIPKIDDSFDITVNLNVVAFAEIDKYDENNALVYKVDDNDGFILDDYGNKIVDTELIEITSAADFITKATAVHNQQAVANAAEYVAAAKYLRGHIVFFGGPGDTTSATESARYYFTTPYRTRTIAQTINAGNQGNAVQVPIYWMWTNTLGQLALPDNVSGKRNGYPVLADNDTDKSEIIAYLTENSEDIFANNSSSTADYITVVSTHVDSSSGFNNTAFNNLSTGYNEADRLIGTRIAYFMIEVTVSAND